MSEQAVCECCSIVMSQSDTERERERDAYLRLDDDDCLPASVPSVLFSLDSPYIVGALLLTSFI